MWNCSCEGQMCFVRVKHILLGTRVFLIFICGFYHLGKYCSFSCDLPRRCHFYFMNLQLMFPWDFHCDKIVLLCVACQKMSIDILVVCIQDTKTTHHLLSSTGLIVQLLYVQWKPKPLVLFCFPSVEHYHILPHPFTSTRLNTVNFCPAWCPLKLSCAAATWSSCKPLSKLPERSRKPVRRRLLICGGTARLLISLLTRPSISQTLTEVWSEKAKTVSCLWFLKRQAVFFIAH